MDDELFTETKESKRQSAKKTLYVWKRSSWTSRNGWYSWRVETVEQAKEMVVYWRKLEPAFYQMGQQWVVTVGEEYDNVVAEFTTGEAVRNGE